jgi:shikimate dehydrogenase
MSNYALIGEKLGHSFSVPIHNAFGNHDYTLVEIPRDELDAFMTKREFKGINVTIPYKQAVMPYCVLDEAAKEIGAVNTIVNKDGTLYGYNTDAFGLSEMMDEAVGHDASFFTGKSAIILGAGGTAKTAAYVLKSKGVKHITVLARNTDKAKEEMSGKCDLVESIENTPEEIRKSAEILVNTTPVGMYPNVDKKPVELSDFPNLTCVFDVIYNPLTTDLIAEAKKAKLPSANGLYMLVCQAKKAEELFAIEGMEVTDSKEVLKGLKQELTNIVLIGMPGSGKTTVGRLLARMTNKTFTDSDFVFKEDFGFSPAECIETNGEEDFRDKEAEVIAKLSAGNRTVIATGGGAIKREENRKALQRNGFIVYIQRNLSNLSTQGRPLSMGEGRIQKLFEERRAIYEELADFVVSPKEGDPEDTAKEIIKAYENTCH